MGFADAVPELFENPALGKHVDPRLDGRIVLFVRGDLVRRFPGLVEVSPQVVAFSLAGSSLRGAEGHANKWFAVPNVFSM